MNEMRLTKPRLVPAVFATFLLGLTAVHTAPAIAEEPGAGQILIENEIKWMDRLSEWHSPGDLLIMATGNALKWRSAETARFGCRALSNPRWIFSTLL